MDCMYFRRRADRSRFQTTCRELKTINLKVFIIRNLDIIYLLRTNHKLQFFLLQNIHFSEKYSLT